MSNVYRRPGFLVLLLLLLGITHGFADQYHYINTFIGERASGMGGAYTAIADGPEGMYYNPAGLAFAPANYVSVSTNAFEFRNWRYEDLAGTGVDFERDSFAFVPNFFGFIQRGEEIVWGFTLFSPDSISVDLRDTLTFPPTTESGITYDQQKTLVQDIDYTVTELGPAVGYLLGDRAGVGVALFGGYTQREELSRETDRYTATSTGQYLFQTQRNVTNDLDLFTLRPLAGFQYLATEDISVGLSSSVNLPVYQEVGRLSSFSGESSQGTVSRYEVETENIFSDGFFSPSVIENRLGVAWFASPRLILSADLMAYLPINPEELDTENERQLTWNAAVGTEYYLTQNFPFRFGLFTNNANTDTVDSGKTGQPEHVDMYGATASIGFASADITLSIGGTYALGVGKGQIIGGDRDIQDVRRSSGSLFVSGGYLF